MSMTKTKLTMTGLSYETFLDKSMNLSPLTLNKTLCMPSSSSKLLPDEMVIKVCAAGVNPVDWKLMCGMLKFVPELPFGVPKFIHPSTECPNTTGFDVAGKVIQIGSKVKDFEVGDEVFGMGKTPGSMAQYYAISQHQCAKKPSNVSFSQAASLPLAVLTSFQAIFTYGGLTFVPPTKESKTTAAVGKDEKKKKVLVLGGSGGTGMFGIQLAHYAGAFVATTCSSRNSDFVKSLGADLVIDYNTMEFGDELKGQNYDLVYDCVGGFDKWEAARTNVLAKDGHFVTIVGDVEDIEMGYSTLLTKGYQIASRTIGSWLGYNPKYNLILTDSNQKDLQSIAKLVEAKELVTKIDSEFQLADFKKAFEKSMSHRARGKIVLLIS